MNIQLDFCSLSSCCVRLFWKGSHTIPPYSRIGRTHVLYAVSLTPALKILCFRLRYYSAHTGFVVIMLIWLFHLKSLEIVMPSICMLAPEQALGYLFYSYKVALLAYSQCPYKHICLLQAIFATNHTKCWCLTKLSIKLFAGPCVLPLCIKLCHRRRGALKETYVTTYQEKQGLKHGPLKNSGQNRCVKSLRTTYVERLCPATQLARKPVWVPIVWYDWHNFDGQLFM